jgi:hypothetical protein
MMIGGLLLNVIQSLIADKAQSLAKEHVTKIIEDNLSDDQIKILDEAVDLMPENSFRSVKDFLN